MKCFKTNCDNQTKTKYTQYCSRSCAMSSRPANVYVWTKERRKRLSNTVSGSNNPNYGNTWTDKKKQLLSRKKKSAYAGPNGEKLRYAAGSANRGKRLSETIRKRRRISMEQTGQWVVRTKENAFHHYKLEAAWPKQMWDKVVLPADFKKRGIFKIGSNYEGYVRDHMFSKLDGFKHAVYPIILRHPANCTVITHVANSRKRYHSSITINELFERIERSNVEWFEHEECLKHVKMYRNGDKWLIK